jgi:arsenate reductase
VIIFHNPRCQKSREALDILCKHGEDVTIREYLKEPPSQKELADLLKKLGMKPEELLRKTESLFKEKYKDKKLSAKEWIKIMCDNPILIERPIVISGNKAIIGRPPIKVIDIL